jgi:protein-tyrosine phosphatase
MYGATLPWAERPYDEIIPRLWMGGHFYEDDEGFAPVYIYEEFEAVFSLHSELDFGPTAGIPHEFLRIPDGRLSALEDRRVVAMARKLVEAHSAGQKVLVRCQAGYNRSGLVVGLAMIGLGYTPAEAINLIREKRSPHALFNQSFVQMLEASA